MDLNGCVGLTWRFSHLELIYEFMILFMKRLFILLVMTGASLSLTLNVFIQTSFAQTSSNLRYTNVQLSPTTLRAIQDVNANKNKDVIPSQTAAVTKIPWDTIAVIISIISGIAAIFGFSISSHKKKRAISKYMGEIDATFSEYKWKAKRCEAELYRLHDLIEEKLKKGKIDESLYELLTKRIDKYLHEIQNMPEGA